jgi:hypothetical protein
VTDQQTKSPFFLRTGLEFNQSFGYPHPIKSFLKAEGSQQNAELIIPFHHPISKRRVYELKLKLPYNIRKTPSTQLW